MRKLFDFENYVVTTKKDTDQIDLPVELNAVSKILSKENLDYHYNTLHANYVKKLKKGEGSPFVKGGVYLHNLFFEQFQKPEEHDLPYDDVHEFMQTHFAGWAAFKRLFKEKALTLEGSGWCYVSATGKIKLINNHQIPKDDIVIIIDMWEHSYYIDYGPDKENYLKDIWQLINWDIVNARLYQ